MSFPRRWESIVMWARIFIVTTFSLKQLLDKPDDTFYSQIVPCGVDVNGKRLFITMDFEVVGKITNIEVIAVKGSIREVARLRKRYGPGRWRKCKGIAMLRLFSGDMLCNAEIHWYEAHGLGKKEMKIKRILDD